MKEHDGIRLADFLRHPHVDVHGAAHDLLARLVRRLRLDVFAAGVVETLSAQIKGGKNGDVFRRRGPQRERRRALAVRVQGLRVLGVHDEVSTRQNGQQSCNDDGLWLHRVAPGHA